MEGLREIATNCYRCKWTQKEINEANLFFCKLDSNEDGKVSFKELRETGIISDHSFFKFNKFDINCNKVLDFEEILALYFYKYKANSILHNYEPRHWRSFRCNGCGCKQRVPDYSCFFCLGKSLNGTYNLCNKCYNNGVAESDQKHGHEKWCLLNQESLGLLKEIHYLLNEVDMKRENKDEIYSTSAGIGASGAVIASACTIIVKISASAIMW